MNVQEAVEQATIKLSQNSDSANLDARILVCHICEIDQTTLIAHPDLKLNETQKKQYEVLLKRRCLGEPLAYITGKKEFWSIDLKVNEHVLIPRPETELLVELTLNTIKNIRSPSILDLGTGSGAIAIAIAQERPDCNIKAVDVSEDALKIAKKNATKHECEIDFIQSDWFENIIETEFDVIVSNPPYIDENDEYLERHVYQYEPKKALISKHEGLDDLIKITNQARKFLVQSGALIVEHGFQQAPSITSIFKDNYFKNIKTHEDLAGYPRCTIGYKRIK